MIEMKRTKRNHSEKKLPRILYNYKKEPMINIKRRKNKAKTIVDKNIQINSGFKHCQYLEQNPDFCDYMEDFILTKDNFTNESFRHLFCVFDGHGGDLSAKLCTQKFPEIFKQCLNDNPFDYESAIKKSFKLMDKEIEKLNEKQVGNTGTIVFINNKLLYCANVGDSSCCLIGKTNEFITIEHKCTNKKEKKRIEKEGGQIIDDRLDGILAISRGFGDFDLKNKGLICEPHITKRLIDHNLSYCILASDGVWDCLNLDDISKIVNENKENFHNLAKIIVETAKRKASEDNISCIVIELNKK
jgi:serine/threonine protein phosphatase PrpC